MKKVLIIASAMIFGVSSSLMATSQNATVKSQPQKTSVSATKQEPKPAVKAETKAPENTPKTTISNTKHKSKHNGIKKSHTEVKSSAPAHEIKK